MNIFCLTQNERTEQSIQKEVKNLSTLDEKRLYLEDILKSIQDIEMERESLMMNPLADQIILDDYSKRREALQRENMLKIEAFFNNFGYPSRPELGQYAALAPFAVVYYSDNILDTKEEHFKYFYGAYRFSDLPEKFFLDYLLNYYQIRTDESYSPDSNLTTQQNIIEIFKLLDVEY